MMTGTSGLPQLAQHGQAVAVGQAEIEQDDVDVTRRLRHEGGQLHVYDVEPVAPQARDERLGDREVVLDDEHLHPARPPSLRR